MSDRERGNTTDMEANASLHRFAKRVVPEPILGKVAVTGGLGFVGSHLVAALNECGHDVVTIDKRRPAGTDTRPAAAVLEYDICRASEDLTEILRDVDVVFHLAGNSSGTFSVMNPRWDFETNAVGTFRLVESALDAHVRRFVYLSSAAVYGNPTVCPVSEEHRVAPILPYGLSKLAGELACRSLQAAGATSIVVVRPFVIYGPGEDPRVAGGEVSRFLRWHLNDLPVQVVGDLDRKTRDFIHVQDVAEGLIAIADRAGEGSIVNLGTGRETSLRQLLEMIGVATGRPPAVQSSGVLDDSFRLVADVSRLAQLGHRSVRSLGEALPELIEHLGPSPALPASSTIFRRGQAAEAHLSAPTVSRDAELVPGC